MQRSIKNSSSQSIITKSFYVHEAPFEEPIVRSQKMLEIRKPKIRYNIIFVKTNSEQPMIPQNYLNIPQPQHQERTIIYVLHSKPEERVMSEVMTKSVKHKIIKPEVFFVKYKSNDTMEMISTTMANEYRNHKDPVEEISQSTVPISDDLGSGDSDSELPNLNMLNDTMTNGLVESNSEEQTTLSFD